MSMLGFTGGAGGLGLGPGGDASRRATVLVATYPDYQAAQRAVDYLSDVKFPVEYTAIVGTDLRLVEMVLGRLTVLRAALTGALTGGWFGLFIGLLFGVFTTQSWLAVVLIGIIAGAVWGAIFGGVAHALTRGQRDFASRSSLIALQYAVTVEPQYAEQARTLLARLPGATERREPERREP